MRSMEIQQEGDTLIVSFVQRNIGDEAQIMEIGDELNEIASKVPEGHTIVLDLENVDYFSSAMVGQLVQLQRATRRDKIVLRLRHVSPTVAEILKTMHLWQVFQIDEED